jgi:hypothetical protein
MGGDLIQPRRREIRRRGEGGIWSGEQSLADALSAASDRGFLLVRSMQPGEEGLARRREEDLDGRGFRGYRLLCALTGVRRGRGQSGLEAFVVRGLVSVRAKFGQTTRFIWISAKLRRIEFNLCLPNLAWG